MSRDCDGTLSRCRCHDGPRPARPLASCAHARTLGPRDPARHEPIEASMSDDLLAFRASPEQLHCLERMEREPADYHPYWSVLEVSSRAPLCANTLAQRL